MPIYDFVCTSCGERKDDQYYTIKDLPSQLPCDCGKVMVQAFDAPRKAQIHLTHSGMYGRYHPGFGCIVRDYAHKQELLKKYDCIEASDLNGGVRQATRDVEAARQAEWEEKQGKRTNLADGATWTTQRPEGTVMEGELL